MRRTIRLNVLEGLKLYEVQKYVSLTSHMWSGFNLIANLKLWQRMPPDVQKIIETKHRQIHQIAARGHRRIEPLAAERSGEQGMAFNMVDPASFRARLGAYYAHWKEEIGAKTWSLLEQHVGKLGA